MTDAGDILISRTQLREVRTANTPLAPLHEGEALFAVRRIALTANNVTYAVAGDSIGYWRFFPAPDGTGRAPVWGFADLVESRVDGLVAGERIWGYWPLGTHVVLRPERISPRGFVDASPHRADLPGFYNLYRRGDRLDARGEGVAALFRPLFATAFLIHEQLEQASRHGAAQLLIGSASSKTGIGLGFLAKECGAFRVVGLTSRRNLDFCRSLGCYDQVLTYEDVASALSGGTAVFVDMAGDQTVTASVHDAFGDLLKASIQVGITHWEAPRGAPPVSGPKPAFFFAPTVRDTLAAAIGGPELERRLGEAQVRFHAFVDRWLEIEERHGLPAAASAWTEVASGNIDPSRGLILTF